MEEEKGKLIQFPKIYKQTFTDDFVPVNNILKGADKADLEDCLVIGVKKDGEFYFASASASTARVIFLLEKAKKILLEQI